MVNVYQFLLFQGQLTPILACQLSHPLPQDFRSDLQCAYHSCQLYHEEKGCTSLKHKIQDLMDSRTIVLEDPKPDGDPSLKYSEVTMMVGSLVPYDFSPEWV